jgi:hypothetical protein
MNFLAPFALALAGAAAVPLLLHLLRRKLGEKVEFPAVRYLLRAEKEHSRQLKLRNLLLMLLRVLAVLALALAAARPVGRLIGTGHAPTALAVVLDNSLSTSAVVNGAPVLAKLKATARAAVDRAASGDRLWLVTADGRVTGGSSGAIKSEIDRTEPLAGAGNLPAAVVRAAQLAKGAGIPARQLAVLTDAQASTWTAAIPLDGVAAIVYAPTLTPPKNRAVVRAESEPLHWTPRGAVRAATSATDSVTFRITLGTRAAARGTAAPGADILVRLEPAERGWVAGAIELEPDEMRGDDSRYFAVHIGAAPAVTADPSVGAFARTAVDALAQSGRIARGPDVIITEAESAHRPAVIFAPADPVQLATANRALDRADIPWKFAGARTGPAPVKGAGLSGVTATHWYVLEPRGTAVVGSIDTLATAGNDAWAVAGEGYVLIASPLTAEATDLPLRASWVPWLGQAIADHLSGDAGAVTEASPGASVTRPSWARVLEEPDGTMRPITEARITAPTRSGVYFWMRGAVRAGALVVNPEVQESDLTRLPIAELRTRFSGATVEATDASTTFTAAAFTLSGRRSLDGLFLAAALLLLAAEAFATRAPSRAEADA